MERTSDQMRVVKHYLPQYGLEGLWVGRSGALKKQVTPTPTTTTPTTTTTTTTRTPPPTTTGQKNCFAGGPSRYISELLQVFPDLSQILLALSRTFPKRFQMFTFFHNFVFFQLRGYNLNLQPLKQCGRAIMTNRNQ